MSGIGRAYRCAARLRVLAIALAGVLALAGCTAGSGGKNEGPGGSGGGAPTGAAPRRGGTLAIALLAPRSLDPASAARPEEQLLVGNLFDGLTAIDASSAVRPAVAASWSSDPSLRHWRFQLRPDARYSDGSPVRAADFKFAWERLASPRTRPRTAPPAALLEAVEGYQAFASGHATQLAGVSAPDPTTLVVDLTTPLADLPAIVANPRLSPLPRSAAGAVTTRPVGNGPFSLAAGYSPSRPFDLVPNQAYAGLRPDLDRVRVVTVPDDQTAWLSLQHSQVRLAPVPLEQVAAARALYGLSPDGRSRPGLLQGPETAAWSLGFSLRAGPARDPRWRQAVSLAIDRQAIAVALAGAFSPATGIVPHGVPGAGQATCPTCAHDPTRARALLAQVGKAGRETVDLAVPATARDRRIADRIAGDLAAVGIRVRIVQVDPAEDPVRLVRTRHPVLFAVTETAAYPRMDAFLSRQFSTHGAANPTGYADPTVDGLLAQARATAGEPARTALYQRAEATILADAAVAPILERRHAAVLAPGVEGLDLTPWGALDLSTARLSNSPK